MSKRKRSGGVREISPVSIYGEVYGGKDLRKRCVLNLNISWDSTLVAFLAKIGRTTCRELSSVFFH